MPYTEIAGSRLYYEEEGAGRPLVLLHGLGASGEDWEFVRPRLAAAGHRLIVPDLSGFGRSRPARRFGVVNMAADVWALLDRLGVGQFDLVGHSMGGAVAQQMALDQPQRVERLALADTVPSFRTDTVGRKLLFATRYSVMALLGPRRLARKIALQLFPLPGQDALRERTVRRGQANDRSTYLKTIRALVSWSVLERLDEFQMPVLVMVAEHDYFPVADAEDFASMLPSARLKVFAGAHHALPLEVPEEFSAELLDFLQAESLPLQASA